MIENIAQFIASLLTIIIIVIMFFQYQQTSKHLRFSFFAEYTRRYHEIMYRFPIRIFDDNFDYDLYPIEEKEAILRNMRVYFDLCSEEYFLMSKDKLEEEVWVEWDKGIRSNFKSESFKSAWELFKYNESGPYDEFRLYINSIIYKRSSRNLITQIKEFFTR